MVFVFEELCLCEGEGGAFLHFARDSYKIKK